MKKLLIILFCASIIVGCSSNNKNNDSNEQDKYAHLHNTTRGKLDNIPFYVDTSQVTQDELKSDIAYNDSIDYLMAIDSLYADSIMDYIYETYGPEGTECGQDGQILFGSNLHIHSGRWVDETGYEWIWCSFFDNDTMCPICNRTLDKEENIESNWIVK